MSDHRIPAAAITHPNGSDALDLRFDGYEIRKGKYAISGLPAVYAAEDEAETLEIYLKDTSSDIRVILKYGVLEKKDIITRSLASKQMEKKAATVVEGEKLDLLIGSRPIEQDETLEEKEKEAV